MKTNSLKSTAARSYWIFVPTLVVVAYVIVEVQRNIDKIAISNLDYFPRVERAVRFSFSAWDACVNPTHPVGFAWLVRPGLEMGVNAARWGQWYDDSTGVRLNRVDDAGQIIDDHFALPPVPQAAAAP